MSSKLRVLRVVHYPVFSGPHNEQLRLNQPLEERGVITTMLLPEEPGNALERLRSSGVEVVTMPLHRVRATKDIRVQSGYFVSLVPEILRIRRLIEKRKIDVVVVGGLANPQSAIAARLSGIPVVWQILDTHTPRMLRTIMVPLVKRLANAILFDGEALVEFHFGDKAVPVPTVVYYPPVDTKVFRISSERREQTRHELGIPANVPVVGMVANLNPMKGIEYFIRAAAMIYAERPDCWFLLVGERYATHEAYYQRVQREIEDSGIPRDRMILTGGRSNVEVLYPAMDLKLITSVPNSEGTTTTAMEALACGVPVIAADVGAVGEIITEGKTGMIVPSLQPRAHADAALRLLNDVALRTKMRVHCRESAVERFDVSVCADAQVRALEKAVAHASRKQR